MGSTGSDSRSEGPFARLCFVTRLGISVGPKVGAPEQALDRSQDVVLADEGHLDVDLGELRLAVGS